MRRQRQVYKVRETCSCGAVLDYEGPQPRSAANDFRYQHETCRQRLKSVRVIPAPAAAVPADTDKGERG